MKDKQLFALRKEGSRTSDKVSELGALLNSLFGKNRIFPMVVGYLGQEKGWEVKELVPLTNSDRLTVENYLEAINLLSQPKGSGDFRTLFVYQGVDTLQDDEWGAYILGASIRGLRDSNHAFSLQLNLSALRQPDLNHRTGYSASSGINPTELEKRCSRFVGPNINSVDSGE